jgi:predicted transcriptional regulator
MAVRAHILNRMSQPTVSLELSEDALKTLDEIASNMETDRATVLREAVDLYLSGYNALKAESEEAHRAFEAGETISQDEMEARFEAMKASHRTQAA